MSLRPLFAALLALAMLIAPLGISADRAMASSGGMPSAHCADDPAGHEQGKAAEKPCCLAMCAAVALTPLASAEELIFTASAEPAAAQVFSRYALAKLPTPPPRHS